MRCKPKGKRKSKTVYRQLEDAQWAIAMQAHELKLHVYQCTHCCGYHLTRQTTDLSQALMEIEELNTEESA